MPKRYQVFVSSTFRDLKEHRQTVIKSLMEMNAFPVGMELFPATDDDAWTLIKRVIDESDYYLVIVGGRYGSIDAEGVSFTEKEYDYALTTSKPIIAFLHEDPTKLPRGDTDLDEALWSKLQVFREKAKRKVCRFWRSREELLVAVLTSYSQLLSTHPAVGWVRGDLVKTEEDVRLLSELNERIAKLESERARLTEEIESLQIDRVDKSRPKPRILNDFAGFLRRFKVEWDAEEQCSPRNEDAARTLLEQARRDLLEFVVEIDEQRHPWIALPLRDAVAEIAKILRAERTMSSRSLFDTGSSLLSRLDGIKLGVENADWS